MANSLVSLYEADFDERWIDRAIELAADLPALELEEPDQASDAHGLVDHAGDAPIVSPELERRRRDGRGRRAHP